MRLLRARTITLELFFDDREIPPYAVLSHTWGAEEVTFQEMRAGAGGAGIRCTAGFKKIEGCCRQALRDELEYVWVDTCCIDKSSSAELSEAINSMFRWYKQAKVCYAYLSDVPANLERRPEVYDDVCAAYQSCRWFTRGWTLQELLAPADVQFFDAGWNSIGTKITNLGAIEKITGIGRRFLRDSDELQQASVAQRMAWVADRKTTRREDQAYCLLGIFGINMPLLYGEGDKAFVRLQEEIMEESDDQSLFAWGLRCPLDQGYDGGLFASSPKLFVHCDGIIFWGQLSTERPTHYHMTNKGLRIELPLVYVDDDSGTAYAVLDCMSNMRFVGLPISRAYHDDVYQRTRGSVPRTLSAKIRKGATRRVIYLQKDLPSNSLTMYFSLSNIITTELHSNGYRLVDAHPPHAVLKVEPDAITCGDAHQILLLFQRIAATTPPTIALLVTSTYKPGEHDLSRPVLADMQGQVAPGPKAHRFAALVLQHGFRRIGKALKLRSRTVVGADAVATEISDKKHEGWTIRVRVDTSARGREDEQRHDGGESDSDDLERISMDAMAAMVKNTNRDFRQRQSWAMQQKRPRKARAARWMAIFVLVVSGLGSIAWNLTQLQRWLEEVFSPDLHPFYGTLGAIVAASFAIVAGQASRIWKG